MEKTKNIIIRTLLSIAVVLSTLGLGLVLMPGAAAAAEVTPDGTYVSDDDMFSYTVTDGKAQITRYNYDMESNSTVTIPSTLTLTVGGTETTSIVTSLGEDFLFDLRGMTSIQVDENNENYSSINGVLYDKAGTTLIRCPKGLNAEISVPEGVTAIAEEAFSGCQFTSVTLPESLTSIGDNAFHNSYIKSIILPQGLISIGNNAFDGCASIESISLPQGLTSIGDNAFRTCTKLTGISIPASVTSIGSAPFFYCTTLTAITVDENNMNYSSENGLLYNKAKTTLIQCPGGLSGEISLPESLTGIGASAFYNCKNITSIILPQGLTSIGDSAFFSCSGITTISLPDSLKEISEQAFYGCSGLTSIILPQGLTSIGDGAFGNCAKLTGINIPASVTSIGRAPFQACTALTAITVDENNMNYSSENGLLYNKAKTTLIQCPGGLSGQLSIPEGVAVIADYALFACTKLTAISLPDSLREIGQNAFYACSGLTSISLPQGLTSIGDYAFGNCSKLTGINIPASVTSIACPPFLFCRALKTITVDKNNVNYSSIAGVLYDKAGTTLIRCPGGFTGKFNVPEGVAIIADNAFDGCSGLTGITLPQSLTHIGDLAFQSCYGLSNSNLIIPASVISIGQGALGMCPYSSVTFYSPTTIINNDAESMQLEFGTKIIGWDPSTAKDFYRAMYRTMGYTFQALTPRTVTSVPVLSDINVANGTTLENIGLPSTVEVTLSDASTQTIEVTWDSGSPAYSATTAGTYSFSGTLTNLPVSVINPEGITVTVNVIVATGDNQPTPVYTVSPVSDPDYYTLGITKDGINTMTINDAISGLKYFPVNIIPVIPHSDQEAVVFTHLRNGVQLSINVTKADFDQVNSAQAGFNVRQSDVIKVYIVDNLTNATDVNPVILQ